MQKKCRYNLILSLFIMCLMIMPLFGANFAYAENIESNYKIFSPDENYYVELTSPSKIAANKDNLVIYDDGKLFIKGQFLAPIENTPEVSSLQVSNNIVCYTYLFKANLINKTNTSSTLLTDSFDKILQDNSLPIDSINDIYLSNDKLYFVIDKILYSVTYTGSTIANFTELAKDVSLMQSKNLYVMDNELYYTTAQKKLNKLNLETKEITSLGEYNDNIALSNKYFVRYNENSISIFDNKGNKNEDISSNKLQIPVISSIVVNGDELLICDKENKGVVVFDIATLFETLDSYPIKNVYGKTGNFPSKFDNPTKIKHDLNKTFVLDSNNNQIKDVTDKQNIKILQLPENNIISFAVNNESLYMFNNTKLFIYDLATYTLTNTIEKANIKNIEPYKDSIIVQIDNSLSYLEIKDENVEFKNLITLEERIINFDLEKEGSFIYIYHENNIDKYIIDKTINKIQNINLTEHGIIKPIQDFEIDKNGNIFALYDGNKLCYLKNNALKYDNAIILTLYNKFYSQNTFSDLEIATDKLLLSDSNRNLIYEVTDPKFNKNTIVSEIKKGVVEFEKKPLINPMETKITTQDTLFYSYINNLEVANVIPKDTVIFVFNEPNTNLENKQLVLFGDKLGFVYSNNLNPVVKTALNYNGKSISNFSLYIYPAVTDESNLFAYENKLPIGTKVRVLNSFDSFDNGYKWLEVEYEGNRYFAVSNDIVKDNEVEKTINQMITKSKQIGLAVNMYQLADTSSNVILTIEDGVLVDVLGEIGDFYKVKYKEHTGYILKEQLIKDGLTNNQIVAIVVSTVTLAVALVIFISTLVIKKNRKRRI